MPRYSSTNCNKLNNAWRTLAFNARDAWELVAIPGEACYAAPKALIGACLEEVAYGLFPRALMRH